ncbi:hypothetical protein LTR10_019609 [Elasticomyces elasticus]|uniref:NmrA-like domain-containing protein n=1 Tax=Exophiala sideris TaxID=1016849 RepID=A0ABR0JNQ2_9EURO|nr:hypothetical protein LTR10_019609 [Elasticomyces elasticus]KAK5038124.1 hypothetical protein LTS07_001593 [Exophiala sideris]KAK5044108.1 hypothetical protein LTR13_000464 [Exophiala sideris]KAK5067608.1 hypothetical protein LTR69_001597 [Exophiala sideris]KAK5184153.1 hypothetical protein LTR44_003659 [Eurotiomycetes sp. CCFEE 6388]
MATYHANAGSKPRIAVAGVGALGLPVVLALLEASHPVTILTRSADQKKEGIPSDANVTYATVDYKSVDSLKEALKGHFGVVSTLNITSAGDQEPLIEAAILAGVTRFIPSEFGADSTNPNVQALPFYAAKLAIQKKLAEVSAESPGFTYTIVINGPFLDWCLDRAFLSIDLKKHSATIFNGGDRKFSVTTLANVAKAVVGIFAHVELTKNRIIHVHDAVLTQHGIIALAKRRDPSDWTLQHSSIEETKANALATFARGDPDELWGAISGMILTAVYGEGYGAEFTGRTQNEILGVPLLTEEELEEVIAVYQPN